MDSTGRVLDLEHQRKGKTTFNCVYKNPRLCCLRPHSLLTASSKLNLISRRVVKRIIFNYVTQFLMACFRRSGTFKSLCLQVCLRYTPTSESLQLKERHINIRLQSRDLLLGPKPETRW